MFEYDLDLDLVSAALTQVQEFFSCPDDDDFWLDPYTVLYISHPEDDDILAATVEDLSGDLGYLEEFISRDFIKTYLLTEDLMVLIVSEHAESKNAIVACADRSSKSVLLKESNLFDATALQRLADTAAENTKETMKGLEVNYKFIVPEGTDKDTKQMKMSRRRLISMMQDIEVHAVSRYTGKTITYRQDL